MPDVIDTHIETVAQQPQQATVDGVKVVNHKLTDLIEAAAYLDGKAAISAANRSVGQIVGVRTNQLSPGGTT